VLCNPDAVVSWQGVQAVRNLEEESESVTCEPSLVMTIVIISLLYKLTFTETAVKQDTKFQLFLRLCLCLSTLYWVRVTLLCHDGRVLLVSGIICNVRRVFCRIVRERDLRMF